MSGRTVPRFALVGLLVGTLAVSASAQEARPAAPVMPDPVPPPAAPGIRIVVPNPGPGPLEQRFDAAVPLPHTDHRQVFNFGTGLFGSNGVPARPACPAALAGGFGSYCAPALPPLQRFTLGDSSRIVLIGAEDVLMAAPTCPPCPLPRIAPNPLLGTWYHELPGQVIAATFTHDELKLCMTHSAEGYATVVTVTAHYAVTKDGLVFGAVTGADADVTHDLKPGESTLGVDGARITLAAAMKKMVDVPFSFRVKHTSVGMMFSHVKFGLLLKDEIETEIFGTNLCGMFKPAKDGRVPTPVSMNAPAVGAQIGNAVDQAATPAPLPTMSVPAAPGDAAAPFGPSYLSRELVPPPCQLPQTVKPAAFSVPGDATKQLATEAFGQLLQQSGVLPSGPSTDHVALNPAVLPMPREVASGVQPVETVGPVKGVAVGSWYRDVAGKRCVVTIAPDHLTLAVSETHDENGKVSTASLVITADYHMTRDGMTAVGLITGVDVTFEGEFPNEDSKPFFEMLGELQKALEDKPFALTFRGYDSSLVIGNVRMPSVSDRMEVQPAGYMAGRYKPAGDKLPKQKAIKIEPKALVLPPGVYGALTVPTGDALPPQAIPLPAPRVVPSSASEPAVPLMPQPVPPPGSNAGADALKQMYSEWRRLWFNDQPSRLTPERIHGGIY